MPQEDWTSERGRRILGLNPSLGELEYGRLQAEGLEELVVQIRLER